MFDTAENLMKASLEANDLYNDDTQETYTELVSILLNFWREKLQKLQTRSEHSEAHKILNDETSPALSL
jgi:ABC-type nitrate/sulfonate/bicarbonate transport system substrate-binding protein